MSSWKRTSVGWHLFEIMMFSNSACLTATLFSKSDARWRGLGNCFDASFGSISNWTVNYKIGMYVRHYFFPVKDRSFAEQHKASAENFFEKL